MTVVWAAFIFYLSTAGFGASFSEWLLREILSLLRVTVPPATFDLLHLLLRKAAHITEYGILGLLVYASLLEAREFEWRPRLALRSIVIAGAYSLTDELHQRFVPGRTASFVDCGIDTAGAALATLVVYGRDWLRRVRDVG